MSRILPSPHSAIELETGRRRRAAAAAAAPTPTPTPTTAPAKRKRARPPKSENVVTASSAPPAPRPRAAAATVARVGGARRRKSAPGKLQKKTTPTDDDDDDDDDDDVRADPRLGRLVRVLRRSMRGDGEVRARWIDGVTTERVREASSRPPRARAPSRVDRRLYFVCVGSFASAEAAQRAFDVVEANGGDVPFIPEPLDLRAMEEDGTVEYLDLEEYPHPRETERAAGAAGPPPLKRLAGGEPPPPPPAAAAAVASPGMHALAAAAVANAARSRSSTVVVAGAEEDSRAPWTLVTREVIVAEAEARSRFRGGGGGGGVVDTPPALLGSVAARVDALIADVCHDVAEETFAETSTAAAAAYAIRVAAEARTNELRAAAASAAARREEKTPTPTLTPTPTPGSVLPNTPAVARARGGATTDANATRLSPAPAEMGDMEEQAPLAEASEPLRDDDDDDRGGEAPGPRRRLADAATQTDDPDVVVSPSRESARWALEEMRGAIVEARDELRAAIRDVGGGVAASAAAAEKATRALRRDVRWLAGAGAGAGATTGGGGMAARPCGVTTSAPA